MLKYAVAAATAMINTAGTSIPSYNQIADLFSKVRLANFDN